MGKSKMKNLQLVLAVVSVLTLSPFAGLALATPNEKVKLMWDGTIGSPDIDSDGPTGFGFVNYSQNSSMVRTVVALKNAEPSVTYTVYLTCGPTHDQSCGFISIGKLITDENGNGNTGAIWTMLSEFPTDSNDEYHIDIIRSEVFLTPPLIIDK
jgi:hypothetical protein